MIKLKITKFHKFLIFVFIILTIGAFYKNKKNSEQKSDVIYLNTMLEYGTKSDKINYLFSDFSDDLVIGSDNAKITIIEYYSYFCKYCQAFNRYVVPNLKQNFIDKGLVKLVYRPVFNRKSLLLGGVLNCIHDYDTKIEINNKFFSLSNNDLNDFETFLNNFIKDNKLNEEEIKECYDSERILNKIVYNQKRNVELLNLNKGVPLFVINKEIYKGYMDYNKLENILNEIINNKSNKNNVSKN